MKVKRFNGSYNLVSQFLYIVINELILYYIGNIKVYNKAIVYTIMRVKKKYIYYSLVYPN